MSCWLQVSGSDLLSWFQHGTLWGLQQACITSACVSDCSSGSSSCEAQAPSSARLMRHTSFFALPACPASLLQRRRQGKRRYLLPDPPQHDSQSSTGPGGAGPSGLAASAGSVTANRQADSNGSAHEDDAEMTPDQIRPHLRSLGDSVTSAVR